MIENNALESTTTLTPSCSTTSSNRSGFSTYSRWYDMPAHPLFRTPIRMSWGVGEARRSLIRTTAVGDCLYGKSRVSKRVPSGVASERWRTSSIAALRAWKTRPLPLPLAAAEGVVLRERSTTTEGRGGGGDADSKAVGEGR